MLQASNPIREWLVPHGIFAPVSKSFLAVWYYCIQGPTLGKAIIYFCPSEVCIAPSGTMKASHQGGNFPVSSQIDFSMSCKHVWRFSNRVLKTMKVQTLHQVSSSTASKGRSEGSVTSRWGWKWQLLMPLPV